MAINFALSVKSNAEAEALLSDAPRGAYVAWRVPYEQNQFRVTYVTEEGSLSAPRRLMKSIDVTFLESSGVYVIHLQLNQTPYDSLHSLIRERVYLNHEYAVPGTQDRPEPPRSAIRVPFSDTTGRQGARPAKVKKATFATKVFSALRVITPRFMDKCVWLWDRLPQSFLLFVGAAVVLAQVLLLVWAWSMRDDVFMEKQRLESMCQRGLDEASALFATVLKNECQNGDGGWKNSLSTLHAKLEDEFMHSPAGVGIFRVSVAYLAAVAGLCVLSWIGFPASQLDYAEELETSTSARAEAVAAEILAAGGGLATVDRPVRSKAGRKPAGGAPKFLSASTTWALFNAASLSVAIMCIVLGYKYYSIPETISQQWEDAFINMHPASFRNFPQCVEMAAPAIASYLHTPHILTLKLREEVEGQGCLFGGQPVPRLHEWIISKHGDLPLIHCNSIIMPSTVGFVRLILLAVAGVIVANTIVLVLRDVLCDISMVGLTKRKRD